MTDGGVFTSADSRVKELEKEIERLKGWVEVGANYKRRAEAAEAKLAKVANLLRQCEMADDPWPPIKAARNLATAAKEGK